MQRVIFYDIERAIKTYRQFSQKRIYANGFDITIDQWLVLNTVRDTPNLSQNQIAEIVFKDIASVTRIIELLVKKKYLKRSTHPVDRRRFKLSVTIPGKQIIKRLLPTIESNRTTALRGVSVNELNVLQQVLLKIINNCK